MTISTPYGVTCQIFVFQEKFNDFLDHEVTDLKNLAPATTNLIMRVQFSTHQVVANCTPSSPLSCYDFSIWVDPIVRAINASGLICHLGFNADARDAPNGWLKGTCPATGNPYMLANEWAKFASNVATYYTSAGNPHIEIIECGNEDYNADNVIGTCNQPEVAAQTATQVYQAVKAVTPDILVGAPATISINNQCGGSDPFNACDWWSNFFQASPQADFVNYHQYPGGISCCGNKGTCYTLLQEAQYIRSLQGASFIPLWCTEIGFAIGNNTCEVPPDGAPIDDAIQANLLMEAMNVGRTSGSLIQAIFWYTMDYGNSGYSLIHPKGKIYPAYTTYQNYIAQYPTWT